MASSAPIELDSVIVACAISAGIHAALVPDHFHEGAGAGSGFLAAAVLLTGLVVVLTQRPASFVALVSACVVLAGLLASYGLATTSGFPLLHPEPESIDGFALATKAIEAVGLLVALHLVGRRRPTVASSVIQRKGAQT